MEEFKALAERWVSHYMPLPGKRLKVTVGVDAAPETFWVLGQEHHYLVGSRQPYQEDQTQRSYTLMDTRTVTNCEVTEDPFTAPPAPHESKAQFDPNLMLFALGRVTVHALTPSGSRRHLEVTGVEPAYGGFFVSSNHVLGFALHHLHVELQNRGLVAHGALPLREGWTSIPVKSATAPLPAGASAAAAVTVYALETRSDQIAGVTVTRAAEPASKTFASEERTLAWGYEALCEEAVSRRILPSEFRPKVRRAQLG